MLLCQYAFCLSLFQVAFVSCSSIFALKEKQPFLCSISSFPLNVQVFPEQNFHHPLCFQILLLTSCASVSSKSPHNQQDLQNKAYLQQITLQYNRTCLQGDTLLVVCLCSLGTVPPIYMLPMQKHIKDIYHCFNLKLDSFRC